MSPRVVTPEAALAAGTSPESLRQVAAWKYDAADRAARGWSQGGDHVAPDQDAAARHRDDAAALMRVAQEVERLRGRKSRRRMAMAVQAAAQGDRRAA